MKCPIDGSKMKYKQTNQIDTDSFDITFECEKCNTQQSVYINLDFGKKENQEK